MVDPTIAGAAAKALAPIASKAAARTTDPLVAVRAGGPEDVAARCDALVGAAVDYFYQPFPEHQKALRKAQLLLDLRCNDDPTRTAAREFMLRVIDYHDPALNQADWEALLPDGYYVDEEDEQRHRNALKRSDGTLFDAEAQLYAWIEEFHRVVHRGRLVRAREKAGRWLRAANPIRLFRRHRTTPALPTAN